MGKKDSIIGEGFSQGANLLKGIVGWGCVPVHWYYSFVIIPFSVNVFLLFFIEIGKVGFEAMMFLSGMFLTLGALRGEQNETHSWKAWYKRRLIRLYPNLILACLLNLYFYYFLFGVQHDMNTILLSLSGLQSIPINPAFWGIVSHYWFFTLMLSCYLFFPFFYYLIKKRFKLMIILSIVLYVCFIIFFEGFNSISQYIMRDWFGQDLNLWYYSILTPRYFPFFFGMLYGYWIEQNDIRNRNIFENRTKLKFLLIISIILLLVLHLFLLSFLLPMGTRGYYTQNIFCSNLIRTLTFPSMGVLLTILTLMVFNKKPRVNKIFELPGEEVFEIILLHSIPIALNVYIIIHIEGITLAGAWFISIPLLFITSFLLAYPFYNLGRWVKKENKIHSTIIIIASSLLIYGILANLLLLFHVPQLNYFFSIIVFDSIVIFIVISSILYLKYKYEKFHR